MDHLKGDRKIDKMSYTDDLIITRDEDYWNERK
jgi:hypothetical protein